MATTLSRIYYLPLLFRVGFVRVADAARCGVNRRSIRYRTVLAPLVRPTPALAPRLTSQLGISQALNRVQPNPALSTARFRSSSKVLSLTSPIASFLLVAVALFAVVAAQHVVVLHAYHDVYFASASVSRDFRPDICK